MTKVVITAKKERRILLPTILQCCRYMLCGSNGNMCAFMQVCIHSTSTRMDPNAVAAHVAAKGYSGLMSCLRCCSTTSMCAVGTEQVSHHWQSELCLLSGALVKKSVK